jgi:hypothetical protein
LQKLPSSAWCWEQAAVSKSAEASIERQNDAHAPRSAFAAAVEDESCDGRRSIGLVEDRPRPVVLKRRCVFSLILLIIIIIVVLALLGFFGRGRF